jgi:hypothetical protein
MIKKFFLFISKKLNTILKFINIRILKRKTGMTVIEFMFLVLSWFQKTIFYKVLTIVYKITVIILAFISFGVFYSENFRVTDINQLLYRLKIVLITIYNIVLNTILAIYNLIFNRRDSVEEPTPEPHDFYLSDSSMDYWFKEESNPWYHDGYIIGFILILLICLGLVSYKNWDSDQTIKENMCDTFLDIYNFIKNIKDSIINSMKKKPKTSEDLNLDIDPLDVDPRILCDPYYYTFFKKLNKLKHWPKFDSPEHDDLVAESVTGETKFYVFTYDHYEKIVLSGVDFIKKAKDDVGSVINKDPNSKLNHLRKVFQETGEEYYRVKEKYPEIWGENLAETSNKGSTLDTNYQSDKDFFKTSSYDLAFKNSESENSKDVQFIDSNSSFGRRLKGSLKSDKKDETIMQKSVHFIDDLLTVASGGNEFENSVDNQSTTDLNVGQMSQPQAPPAPPAPPTTVAAQDSKTRKPTSLFDALSNIKNIQLKSVDEARTIPELSNEEILKRNAGKVVTSSAIRNEIFDKTLKNFDQKETPYVSKYSVEPKDVDYTLKPQTTDKPKSLLDELSQFDANSLKAQELNDQNKKILIEMRGLDPDKFDIDQSEIDRANELIRQGIPFRWVDANGLTYENDNPRSMFSANVLNKTDQIDKAKSVETTKPQNQEVKLDKVVSGKKNWAGILSKWP